MLSISISDLLELNEKKKHQIRIEKSKMKSQELRYQRQSLLNGECKRGWRGRARVVILFISTMEYLKHFSICALSLRYLKAAGWTFV